MPRAGFICVMGMLLSMMSSRVHAQPLAAHAMSAYDRADYAEAARGIRRSLAEESLDAPATERLYLAYATSLVALGDDDGARAAFATLLALDPAFRPERDSSPKLLDVFERARPEAPASAPRIEPLLPAALPDGPSVGVAADVTASARLTAVVEFRGDEAVRARRRMSCAGRRCTAAIPVGRAPAVEVRFALVTPEGAMVAATPLVTLQRARAAIAATTTPAPAATATTLTATPTTTPPTTTTARRHLSPHIWIWPVVGVVAVGVAVGLAVGLSSSSPGAELGRVQLQLGARP